MMILGVTFVISAAFLLYHDKPFWWIFLLLACFVDYEK